MEGLREIPSGGQTGPRSRAWNFNHASSLTAALIALLLFLTIPYQVDKPARLFGRALSGLNPALFPRLVLGALFFVSIGYFLASFRLWESNSFKAVDLRGYINIAVTLACVLAFAFALPLLGFVVSGSALIVGLAVFYGNRNHFLTAIVGVLVPAAIYFGFTRLLHVSLPEFPLF